MKSFLDISTYNCCFNFAPPSEFAVCPFQAYGSGCDVVILASNFDCVQIIPGAQNGNIQVGCVECSHQLGRVSVDCTVRHTPTCSFHFSIKPEDIMNYPEH